VPCFITLLRYAAKSLMRRELSYEEVLWKTATVPRDRGGMTLAHDAAASLSEWVWTANLFDE
jgi:hypothetical protein